MRSTVLSWVLAFACTSPCLAQTAPAFDGQAHVSEALNAVRPIAMNRAKVDWPAVEVHARAIAAKAHDTVDLLPAYHLIVWSLHDDHSFMKPTPAQLEAWLARTHGSRYLPDTPRPRISVSKLKGRPVSGRDLSLKNGGLARAVVVPAFEGGDANGAFARSVTDALAVSPNACGYIVDLRGNTGGNMGPMLGGLSPLLGEGFSIPTVAGPGHEDAVLRVEHGQLMGHLAADAPDAFPMGRLPAWPDIKGMATAPVAVMLDQATASSGEAVAVALRGRTNTRFFGEKTFGIASANQDLPLSDGVTLYVAIALLRDAAGRTYPAGIGPDEPVAPGKRDPRDSDDAATEAAKAWLADQPQCGRVEAVRSSN